MNIKRIFAKLKYIVSPISKSEKVKFNLNSIFEGHFKVKYKGISCIRCPFDYVIYQMIISEVLPDLIIEIGTHNGGSALYMADLMTSCGIKGEVHTIDIKAIADSKILNDERIKVFTNGWENYDINLGNGFNKILVIEDAAHTYECTKGVIQKFASLVSLGSYLIVEDGIVDKLGFRPEFKGGPLKAIKEFLPSHPEFFVDRKWCDLFGNNATFNVNGYLKRIQ
jgi:cephalosporin hydroxylase